MEKMKNVVTATTANGSKSNEMIYNENAKIQMAKMGNVEVKHVEFVVNARLFYLDVESGGSWVMYNENDEFRCGSLVDVDVDELSAWLAEKAGQECETQFEFNVGDETFLYDRCSDGSWSVQMYANDEDDFPLYSSEVNGDLYGLMEWVLGQCEKHENDEEKADYSAVIEAIENWDVAKSEMAEIMCEAYASEDYKNDKDLQERKYNAESALLTAAKDVVFEVKELGNPTYLIGNRGDDDMMAIWVIGKYIVTKELEDDEYDSYRCSVLPKFISEIDEWVRESLPTEQLMSDEFIEDGDEDDLKSYCVGLAF